jgi:hypothetical protein
MLPEPVDSHREADAVQLRRIRDLGPRGRLAAALALNATLERLALAGIRARHGRLSAREERLRLFSLRLAPDEMQRAFGWDPKSGRG